LQVMKYRCTHVDLSVPLREFDDRYELCLHPIRCSDRREQRAVLERRPVDLELAELLIKRAQALRREAGADAADVTKLVAVVVSAEQQRAEADPRVARIREAADDELALLHALDLQPVRRAAAAVRRAAPLRHDALESELADLVEKGLALAFELLHVAD